MASKAVTVVSTDVFVIIAIVTLYDIQCSNFIHGSRLTVVSCAAKQSRTRDTTVCYIYMHERSILIERSPEAYCKILPYEKNSACY